MGKLRESIEHQLTDQRVTLCRENSLFAIDEKIALLARGKDYTASLEATFAKQFDDSAQLV